jgi:group I intron endonuclease
MGIIYKVTNKMNGKVYVGKTVQSLNRRKAQHKYNAFTQNNDTYFYNAIRKYGWNSFEWIIIDKSENTNELNELEKKYIKKYKSTNKNFGYNLTFGGEGTIGYHLSEETKKRQSQLMKGENNPFYGKHHTKEAKEKMSRTRKGKCCGKNHPNYGKTGELHPVFGRKHTKEEREKISKRFKGKSKSFEHRKNNGIAKRGGLFGFVGCTYSNKKTVPWNKVWSCQISYLGKQKTLFYYNDPLSAQIVYFFAFNEIYGGED